MKKKLVFITFLLTSSFAFAQTCSNNTPGYCYSQGVSQASSAYGYTGPSASATTAQAALNLADDAPVVLRGKIVQNLGNERYLFADQTGTIQVEIENKVFARSGVQISENDLVEISGEIDKEWNKKTEVEVKMIRKL